MNNYQTINFWHKKGDKDVHSFSNDLVTMVAVTLTQYLTTYISTT